MAAWLDVCRFSPTAGGTTDWTFSAAVVGYQSPTAAGVVNGAIYRYRAESSDLSQWEIGYGAYNTATGVLARTTVLYNSAGTTAKINFTVAPQVAIVALKEDLISIEEANSFTATQRAQARSNISAALKGQLFGLTLSAAGGTAVFGIASGEAADSTGVDLMALGSAYTKSTGSWSLGSGGNALDTGAIANSTWYHVFLIKRPDTGVVDVLFSLSATAPTMPTNYTLFRRIGSMKTDGSSLWTKFLQIGDEFIWDVPVLDANGSGLSSTSTLFTMSTPLGISVLGRFRFEITTTSGTMGLDIQSPLITTRAGSAGTFVGITTSSGGACGEVTVMTDTSSRIRAVANISGGTQATYLETHGWFDRRGRDG